MQHICRLIIIVILFSLPFTNSNLLGKTSFENSSNQTNTLIKTQAQILWSKTFGTSYEDVGKSIIKSSLGGYAICGWTNGSGAGDYDILLIRIASDGTQVWNLTIGDVDDDKGYQVVNCANGDFALSATYTNNSVAITNTDFMLARIANNGTLLWSRTYSGPEQTGGSYIGDIGRSIIECTNGDFVAAGVTTTTTGGCDIWFFRVTSTGQKIWERLYHHWDIDRCFSPHSVVQCTDGGFAIAGYTYNSTDSNDVWLIRTNQNGIPLWNQTFGDSSGYQRPEGLVQCADGGFGIIANTHSFGAGQSDFWVIRTNAFGIQLWNQTYGGIYEDTGAAICAMGDGGFTLGGTTHSFDVGNGDLWLIRTDVSGQVLWNHTVGDPYGNGLNSFIYEGNATYSTIGTTNSLGEPFCDIWSTKIYIAIIPENTTTPITSPTNSTTPTGNSTTMGIVFTVGTIIGLIVMTTVITKRKNK
ncbi:MAG: hypothetical protein ACFFDW_15465 [Candidatus Thorarchaeota archaeon]